VGANIGNVIVVFGGGLTNLYNGNVGSGVVPCTPGTICTDLMVNDVILCNGETYQDSAYLTNTTIEEHYTSSLGCDSAFITNIKVGISTFSTIDAKVCQGETFHGMTIKT
jgi:hypothetical protein